MSKQACRRASRSLGAHIKRTALTLLSASLLTIIVLPPNCLPARAEAVSVAGQGSSVKEATTDALRSAVEQQVGLLVRSTTQVTNARAVSDQVITLTHGFVNGYRVVSQSGPDANGQYSVTVEADIDRQLLESTVSGVTRQKLDPASADNMRFRREQTQNAKKLARALVAEYVRELRFVLPKYRVYPFADKQKPIALEFEGRIHAEVPASWRKEFDALLAIAGDPTELNRSISDWPDTRDAVTPASIPNQLLIVHHWPGSWKGYWVDPTLAHYIRDLLENVCWGGRILDRDGTAVATLNLGFLRQEVFATQGGDLDLGVWADIWISLPTLTLSQRVMDQADAFEMFAYWPSRR